MRAVWNEYDWSWGEEKVYVRVFRFLLLLVLQLSMVEGQLGEYSRSANKLALSQRKQVGHNLRLGI
jgi:hypothetical protein